MMRRALAAAVEAVPAAPDAIEFLDKLMGWGDVV